MANELQKIEAQWGVFKFKADATKCANEILANLPEGYKGEDMVNFARDPGTELHKCFEWDDTVAAEKYRIRQASDVSRSIQITITHVKSEKKSEPQTYRLFYNNGRNTGYKTITCIVKNPDEHERLLNQAKRELESFRNRYAKIMELATVIDAIEEVLSA